MSGPVLVRHVLDEDALLMVRVYCNYGPCMHGAKVPLTQFLDRGATLDTPVPELARWCRCSKCGTRDVQTRTTPYRRGVSGVPGFK